MGKMNTVESVDHHVAEYRALVEKLGDQANDSELQRLLTTEGEWTCQGAATLLMLARNYGTFVLGNALALAEVLDIEDGDCGV